MTFFRFACAAMVALLPCLVSAAETTAPKTNIIFIMADDLGAEALACYGNDLNKTPRLDQMAAGGIKFTEAHATPLCTPTRVQLMTGLYNHRNYTGFGLLDPSQKTFGNYLQAAGYATGIAGKWQLYGDEKQRELAGGKGGSLPEQAGFKEYSLWQVQDLGSRYKDPLITTTSGTVTHTGKYGPDVMNDFARQFIRRHRDEPFFLYYPMVLTHGPFQPTPDSPEFATMKAKGGSDPVNFQAMVEHMDRLVGTIVDEVRAQGLADRTIIFFTGDNGTGKEVTSSVGGKKIQGGKGTTTRYGTNVPLLVFWEGKIKPGQVSDALVDSTDFLPTILELAGTTAPEGVKLDGVSLLRLLLGEVEKTRDSIFFYYEPRWHRPIKHVWAQDKTWKLYSDGRLYKVSDDPEETKPLGDPDGGTEAVEARKRLQKVIDEKLK